MKKTVGILALVLLLTVTVNAQRQQNQRNGNGLNQTPEQIATLQSKRMALALDLDKKQLDAVYKLMKENAIDREKLRSERQNSTQQNRPQRFDLKNSRLDKQLANKAEMKKILSSEQYQKWEEFRVLNNRKGNFKNNKNRNGNTPRRNKSQGRS